MKKIYALLLGLFLSAIYSPEKAIAQNEICQETQGYNMLLIGNSFFRPYASQLDTLALNAGFTNHNSTRITRGGENGRPINFWNDSLTTEHQQIKAVLDQGNVELFGMTSGHEPGDRAEGHRAWIEYALQNNPNIDIFIAIAPIDFPADWDQRAQDFGFATIQELYDYLVEVIVHDTIVEQLRAEFPATNIFTIPTGWATFELEQMYQDSLLLDSLSLFGPKPTSLFTDAKGHQGQIIIETGGLLWLNSIYNVNLSTNTYQTGFNTDLHEIAQQIMDNHDPNYKKCSDLPVNDFCTADDRFTAEEFFGGTEIDSVKNVVYGSAVNHFGNIDTLVFDAYFPNNSVDSMNARPAVVMIHGGGFSGGQKEDRRGECIELAKRGFVAYTISYRLGWNQANPSTQFLAIYRAHQDAHAAIRFIVNNSAMYKIDPNWIFVGGSSAGAITANNLVYTDQSEYEAFYAPIANSLGGLFTSTNSLTNSFTIKGIFNNWGAAITGTLQTNEIVPQVAFHGELDQTVEIDTGNNGFMLGSRAIHDYLLANAVCSDLTVNPNAGHGVYGNNAGRAFRVSRTSCFFKSIMCNNCGDYYATDPIIPDCSVLTACLPPASNYTDSITPTAARLSWEVSQTSEAYQIKGKSLNMSDWVYLNINDGTASSEYVTGLKDNETYIWQIRSFCASMSDTSEWSALDTFTTGCFIADSTWTDQISGDGATLNWLESDGAVSYEIRGRKIGGVWVTLDISAGTVSAKTVTGLQPGQTYEWAVRAHCSSNGNVKSDFTTYTSFTTPSAARLAGFVNETGSFYPNPTSGNLTINLKQWESENRHIRITDTNGRLIFDQNANNTNQIVINTRKWQSGMYFVSIGGKTEKVLVE